MAETQIESVMKEERKFPPLKVMSERAHISSMTQYEEMYHRSIHDPEGFWSGVAEDFFRKQRIPVVPFPEAAVQVFARMWRYVQLNRLRL